jgi:hypothetical protein
VAVDHPSRMTPVLVCAAARAAELHLHDVRIDRRGGNENGRHHCESTFESAWLALPRVH